MRRTTKMRLRLCKHNQALRVCQGNDWSRDLGFALSSYLVDKQRNSDADEPLSTSTVGNKVFWIQVTASLYLKFERNTENG